MVALVWVVLSTLVTAVWAAEVHLPEPIEALVLFFLIPGLLVDYSLSQNFHTGFGDWRDWPAIALGAAGVWTALTVSLLFLARWIRTRLHMRVNGRTHR